MILSHEGGSSGLQYVEELFWKRLWTCRQTDYWMMIHVAHLLVLIINSTLLFIPCIFIYLFKDFQQEQDVWLYTLCCTKWQHWFWTALSLVLLYNLIIFACWSSADFTLLFIPYISLSSLSKDCRLCMHLLFITANLPHSDLQGGVFLGEASCTRKRKRDILPGTWKVRSLYRAGALKAAARELAR